MKCLVTGSAGFFGRVLARDLAARGHEVVGLDLHGGPEHAGPEHRRIRGDVRDEALLDRLCREHRFDAVFHCAALLAHDAGDRDTLWQTNVDGTRVVAEAARRHGTRPFVFVSSNCVYSRSHDEPVGEDVPPEPAEIYGRSKLAAERLLRERAGDGLVPVVLRTPTIIDEGRLGLLAILFEFIDEGRRVWVVGRGDNRYQFVAAADLADACVRAAGRPRPDLYHVGADDVRPLRAVYEHVIREAGTGARVASLPKRPKKRPCRPLHVRPAPAYVHNVNAPVVGVEERVVQIGIVQDVKVNRSGPERDDATHVRRHGVVALDEGIAVALRDGDDPVHAVHSGRLQDTRDLVHQPHLRRPVVGVLL